MLKIALIAAALCAAAVPALAADASFDIVQRTRSVAALDPSSPAVRPRRARRSA
jgi:hypothetical protein